MPSGVKRIGSGAFQNCESLASVVLPDSVVEMEESIFDGCPELVVVAPQGSAAQAYCAENGIRCETQDQEG